MCLSNPTSKMSKSDPAGCVFIMDSPDEISRKFKRAITDSDTERCVRYAPEEKPGVANLMSIYSSVTGKTYDEIEAEFEGKGYGAFALTEPQSGSDASNVKTTAVKDGDFITLLAIFKEEPDTNND